MGFHRRYLTKKTLLSVAQNTFKSFDRYMLSADSYVLDDALASAIWSFYLDEADARNPLWILLKDDYQDKDKILDSICEVFKMIESKSVIKENTEAICKYLDLVGSTENNSVYESILDIMKIFRRRIK